MSDDIPLAPFHHEGLDPAPEPKCPIAEVSEALKGTVHRVTGAIEAGRKPGMPLSLLRQHCVRGPSWFATSRLPVGSCHRPPPMTAWGV
jgi:hypothetical protein